MSKKVSPPTGLLDNQFTTSLGVLITVGPMPILQEAHVRQAAEADWLEAGKVLPVIPTYEVTTAGGEVEVHQLDETMLADPAHKAQWESYQINLGEFNTEYRTRLLRSVVIDCVAFEENPRWAAKHKAKKLRIPADEWERKVYFAETELFGNPDDLMQVIERAKALSGLKAEVLAAAQTSFRRAVEETEKAS